MGDYSHTRPERWTEGRPAKRQRLESPQQISVNVSKRKRLNNRHSNLLLRRSLELSTKQYKYLQASQSDSAAVSTQGSSRNQRRPSVLDRIKQFCQSGSRHRQDSVTDQCNDTVNRLHDSSNAGLQYDVYHQDSLQWSPAARHGRASDSRRSRSSSPTGEEVIIRQSLDYLDSLRRFHSQSRPLPLAENVSRVPYTNRVVPRVSSFSPQLRTLPVGIPARPEVYRPSSLIPDTARPDKHHSSPPPFGSCALRFLSPPPFSSCDYAATATTFAQGSLLCPAEPYLCQLAISPSCSPLSLERDVYASRSMSSGMMFPLSPDPSMENLATCEPRVHDIATSGYEYESDIEDPGLHMSIRSRRRASGMESLRSSLEQTSLEDDVEPDDHSQQSGTPASSFYLERYLLRFDEPPSPDRDVSPPELADSELVLNHWSDATDITGTEQSEETFKESILRRHPCVVEQHAPVRSMPGPILVARYGTAHEESVPTEGHVKGKTNVNGTST